MLLKHPGILLDLVLISPLGGVDEDQERHVGLEEAVAHVVHHGLAQLSAQVTCLAAHVLDGAVQALRRLLLARL